MQTLELSNKDFNTAFKIVKKTDLKINSFKNGLKNQRKQNYFSKKWPIWELK